jgi:hypothetical protein
MIINETIPSVNPRNKTFLCTTTYRSSVSSSIGFSNISWDI